MARQTDAQKATVERVMHEFKEGELQTSVGRKVRNPKQAIAIALHEAGASNQEDPATNRANLRSTKARERGEDGRTRGELYEEARRRNLPGRSKMSREELQRALKA